MVNKQETNQIESFADLFAKQIELDDKVEGKVVKGTIISIDKDMINIDVGYKAEGRINIREFNSKEKSSIPKIVPFTFSFVSEAFSSVSQDSSLLALSLDKTASPFLF